MGAGNRSGSLERHGSTTNLHDVRVAFAAVLLARMADVVGMEHIESHHRSFPNDYIYCSSRKWK